MPLGDIIVQFNRLEFVDAKTSELKKRSSESMRRVADFMREQNNVLSKSLHFPLTRPVNCDGDSISSKFPQQQKHYHQQQQQHHQQQQQQQQPNGSSSCSSSTSSISCSSSSWVNNNSSNTNNEQQKQNHDLRHQNQPQEIKEEDFVKVPLSSVDAPLKEVVTTKEARGAGSTIKKIEVDNDSNHNNNHKPGIPTNIDNHNYNNCITNSKPDDRDKPKEGFATEGSTKVTHDGGSKEENVLSSLTRAMFPPLLGQQTQDDTKQQAQMTKQQSHPQLNSSTFSQALSTSLHRFYREQRQVPEKQTQIYITQQQNTIASEDKTTTTRMNPSKDHYIIKAPPGKLGCVIETSRHGLVIDKIGVDSPLLGKVIAGDIIIAIDDVSVERVSVDAIHKLLKQSANRHRKLTIQSAKNAKFETSAAVVDNNNNIESRQLSSTMTTGENPATQLSETSERDTVGVINDSKTTRDPCDEDSLSSGVSPLDKGQKDEPHHVTCDDDKNDDSEVSPEKISREPENSVVEKAECETTGEDGVVPAAAHENDVPLKQPSTPDQSEMHPMPHTEVDSSTPASSSALPKQKKVQRKKKRKSAEKKRAKLEEEIQQLQTMLSEKLKLEAEIKAIQKAITGSRS